MLNQAEYQIWTSRLATWEGHSAHDGPAAVQMALPHDIRNCVETAVMLWETEL